MLHDNRRKTGLSVDLCRTFYAKHDSPTAGCLGGCLRRKGRNEGKREIRISNKKAEGPVE